MNGNLELDAGKISVNREDEPLVNSNASAQQIRTNNVWRTLLTPKTIAKLIITLCGIISCICIYCTESILQENPSARKALSLFVLVAVLWATEAIPVYATSLLNVILIVFMKILVDEQGQTLDAPVAAKVVMGSMFSSTVLVALGAFTMSLALSKYDISYRLGAFVLSRVGNKPHVVMLAVMFLGLFLSMWMNNVASPVVVVSIIRPLLSNLHHDSVYAKTLLLGVAYSNNIGGMTTPIASPQNLVAFHVINEMKWNKTMDDDSVIPLVEKGTVTWGEFLAVSLPFSFLCTVGVWGFLWLFFRPKIARVEPIEAKEIEPFGVWHVVILVVCLTTIVLWAISTSIEGFIGNVGIVGLIPVVVFFTLPILSKPDFKELSWDVLMLLAGGLALGDAIQNSGLLKILSQRLAELVDGQNLWVILLAFASFIWVFGNFISHTVAAIIILPVIADVGCHLGGGNCRVGHFSVLVIGSVLMDSGAMGLPVTSFPNAQCFTIQDAKKRQYLSAFDYVKTGFPAGILELALLMSVGYGLLVLVL